MFRFVVLNQSFVRLLSEHAFTLGHDGSAPVSACDLVYDGGLAVARR
jgi:hypothetical protein